MRQGFPLIGIPPLAPLKLNDRNNTINLSFMQWVLCNSSERELLMNSSRRFNSTLSNILIDGIDRFRINYVKFSWRDKSMNFSLTFSHLKSNGSYAGLGNFIKYIPIRGNGNYNFDVYSKEIVRCTRDEFIMREFPGRFHDKCRCVRHTQTLSSADIQLDDDVIGESIQGNRSCVSSIIQRS